MYTIKKVLNSSVVLVDRDGSEFILLGKGIGYGKKPGETVDESGSNQVFVPVEQARTSQVQELIASVPVEIVEVTQEIVGAAEKLLGVGLSKSVYLVLADHLSFSIERMREGVRITNRVYWEIKTYYPDEFRAGLVGLQIVRERLGIELPEEEAANLAFHFANARSDGSDYDAMRYAKVMGKLVNLVLFSLNRPVDPKGIHYLRFVTHVKYFVERYFTGAMLGDTDELLHEQLVAAHPREAQTADRIAEYMESQYGSPVPPDELTYLIVHIARLARA